MEYSIEAAMKIISSNSLISGDQGGSIRVPPLVLSRLGRGGKTTMLHVLFNQLKASDRYAPIYISFNGDFQRFPGESDQDAILRLIAVQFINVPEDETESFYRFQFAKAQVLAHLAGTSGGREIVLLIDELNTLRNPLDPTGAILLRNEFLDKQSRYLVFSTHSPMNVDVTMDQHLGTLNIPSSPRGYFSLSMPFSIDVGVIRTMFNNQPSIVPTPAQVVLFGGIPSLLFCSLTNMASITPKVRFRLDLLSNPIAEVEQAQLFVQFVEEILSGDQKHSLVRRFDKFSSVDETNKSHWPLCFISPILAALSQLPVVHKITSLIDYDLSVLAARTETGLDWEIIVQIAILLRCICPPDSEICVPFFGNRNRRRVLETLCVTIPAENHTLEDAHNFIVGFVDSVAVGTILYITPQYAKFPDYDGFLVYKAVDEHTVVVGIQVKLTRGYPKHPVPTWIEKAILIRGNAPERPNYKDKWIYLSKEVMMGLLGTSMAPLYPHSWPAQPLVDNFL